VSQSSVSAVIPHWNRRELLAALLANVASQSVRFAEVIVADNGSTDGSAEEATRLGAKVLALPRNIGFAGAVNRGISHSRGEWVAVLNNDVELAGDWLETALAAGSDPDVWFVTGKLLQAAQRNVIDGTFDCISEGACSWRAGHGRRQGPEWDAPRRIAIAPMTAAIFRRELFERVGPLDEGFESYLEDVDFGLRCAIRGYAGQYEPRAIGYHQGGATLGKWSAGMVRHISRNQLLLVAKHYPRDWPLRYGWPVAVAQLLWGLLAVRHGAGLSWLKGKWEAIRKFEEVAARSEHPPVERILRDGDRQLRELQRRTGYDLYWRLYAALT
jgi:GT2 family glycosyltransferase